MNDAGSHNPGGTLARPGAFIFDYGGTIDTRGCHWGKAIWHAYQRRQVPVGEEAYRQAYVHAERTLAKRPIIQSSYTFRKTLEVKLRIQVEWLRENCPEADIHDDGGALVGDLLNDLYTRVEETVDESRYVLEVLARQFPLALVSNFYGNIDVVLREFRLHTLFQHVVESAVVGVRKPDPAIFQLAADALQLSPADIVVVGDSYDKDLLPARAIGCRTVWVKGEEWNPSDGRANVAEAVLDDGLRSLPAIFGLNDTSETTN
jgi:putative hydrolase of the HAD superfamily